MNTDDLPGAADQVRRLAAEGALKRYAAAATREEYRRLWAGACEIAWPLVFGNVTRRVEHKRGHFLCATGVERLEPECLDRFHDDVEAVLEDLFANAGVPIHNLEGWLTRWLQRATVNGHRRRRGRRGAAQRPRVPVWLAKALDGDPWRVELARSVLDWAGVEATAGSQLWPLTSWAERRATMTGDHIAGEAVVAADVDVVLAAMRRRPAWFEKNVEGPLGRKQAPVWLPPHATAGTPEPEPLVLVPGHETHEALLRELTAAAIDLLLSRIRRGDDPKQTVLEVLGAVFGALPPGHDLAGRPGEGETGPERVAALIDDPGTLDRIMATLLELLSEADEA